MSRILIAGCGAIGSELGLRLIANDHEVWGIRRQSTLIPSPIKPLSADLRLPGSLKSIPALLDWVFIILTSDHFNDLAYKESYVDCTHNLLKTLKDRKVNPKRIFFVSSTSVYGQCDGEWVDESSLTNPLSFSGSRILEAENLLKTSPFPVTSVRFAGIYGPNRTGFLDRVRKQEVFFPPDPPQYRNLIHQDDVVGVLKHLISVPNLISNYIGVDHKPVNAFEILQWMSNQLGVSIPTASISKTNLKRSGTNKRCRNDRILQSGYRFKYPSYQEGYGEIIGPTQWV